MPGISVSKICVPFGGGGINWSSYWETLISATVENAAPTHVVLTFPTASSLVAADFTVAGFTVASASWTDAVLTVVLSEAVLIFDGNLTMTFVKTGQTATVTNNVADDGNTVAWYDLDLATITKDASERVAKWEDKLGSGHDLIQATDGLKPTYSVEGLTFLNQIMKTATFDYNQPCSIYVLIKQITWGNVRFILDGYANTTGGLVQYGTTPRIRINAANYGPLSDQLAIDTWGVVRIVFNGLTSSLQVDTNAKTTSAAGARDMDGITIGGNAAIKDYANFIIRAAIYRTGVEADALSLAIHDSLKKKVTL